VWSGAWLAADHARGHVLDTAPLDPSRGPFTERVRVHQQRHHHRRIMRRPSVPVGAIVAVEAGQIQRVYVVDNKPREVIPRQPLAQARRQPQLLLAWSCPALVDTRVLGPQGSGRKDVQLPRTRPPYPPEFRREAVALIRSGTPLKQAAADLGVSEQKLRNSVRQGDIDAGRVEGLTSDEREELRRLRRENRRLQQEREILKAAAAFFARETDRR
jgi:transposase